MGEPMCGHLARRSGLIVLAFDKREEPVRRLAEHGVKPATMAEIAAKADVILLSLPDGKAVDSVVLELEPSLRPGQCLVDTSTSSVALTRRIGSRLAAKGVLYADAPVARTREAAARFPRWRTFLQSALVLDRAVWRSRAVWNRAPTSGVIPGMSR